MEKSQTPNPKPKISAPVAKVAAAEQKKQGQIVDEIAEVEGGEKTSILKPGILLRAAALAVINLFAVALIIFLLGRLQLKAQEVKRLRSIQLSAPPGEPFSALTAEIEAAEAKTSEIIKYYPDSQGIITFVSEIDKLKAEGVVTTFSFANEEPIRDKTGSLGLPVLIEFTGTWTQIDSALGRVMSLPYLIRAIRIDAEISEDDPSLVNFRFGGFLYVDKNFSQD